MGTDQLSLPIYIFFLTYELTWRIDVLLIDCVQVYSGLYVNEAADLEDEDFESLDDPAVVRYQDRSAYIYMSEILKKITKYLSQAACSNIFFFQFRFIDYSPILKSF